MYNNLLEVGDYIEVWKVASNGSVHLLHQTAAAAWKVASGIEYCMSACYFMANVSSVLSYRSELEDIFQSLKLLEYLNIMACDVGQ